jgi:hypothetical protein
VNARREGLVASDDEAKEKNGMGEGREGGRKLNPILPPVQSQHPCPN